MFDYFSLPVNFDIFFLLETTMNAKRKLLALTAGLVLAGMSNLSMAADEIYIPLISKGFQHQF